METTARFGLPLLAVAQAAKEMTVNEALTLLDAVVQPIVEGMADAPPMTPMAGQGWLVAGAATGPFAGQNGAIAVWTVGGWRFVAATDGMAVWRRDLGVVARYGSTGWSSGAPMMLPSGGPLVDAEARGAIATIVTRLREFGLIAA